jgi:hypothetical protein
MRKSVFFLLPIAISRINFIASIFHYLPIPSAAAMYAKQQADKASRKRERRASQVRRGQLIARPLFTLSVSNSVWTVRLAPFCWVIAVHFAVRDM